MRIVNVQDFEAIGDGVADDTAAVQRAIDAVPRRGAMTVVLFPRGWYRLSGTLVIRSGQRVVLRGEAAAEGPPTLYMSDPNLDFIDASTWLTDLITVDHLRFQGAGPGPGRDGHAIVLGHADSASFDSRITRCHFVGIPGCGIRARYLDGYHIQDNLFERSGHGIFVEEGRNTVICNNRFQGNWRAGIYLSVATHFQIQGNHFDSDEKHSGTAILTSYATTDIEVRLNCFKGLRTCA